MPRPDIEALKKAAKEKAEQARASAKGAKAAAKIAAEDAKFRLKNPPPQFVEHAEPLDNMEAQSTQELNELQQGFRNRAKAEAERFDLVTDSEFWCCFCFQSRDQKEAFLAALKLLPLGDKYIDGVRAAKELGIKLPSADVPYNAGEKGVDKKWLEFVK